MKNCFFVIAMGVGLGTIAGCHDGPMYALKAANPYYAMSDWKKDEALGVTDHERRQQLANLAESIGTMPASRQQFWAGHLKQMLENDLSPEMRRLAVQAAGNLRDASAMALIETGLDDESMKVRMEACRALASRKGDDAVRMLASTIGTETDEDVRHAAIAALSKHKSPIAIDSLRVALGDRNPATQQLVMDSLRGVTGKDLGEDPQVWIAALDRGANGTGSSDGGIGGTSQTRIATGNPSASQTR